MTDRTVTGGVWVTINNLADRTLQLATVLILAHVVGPAAFGTPHQPRHSLCFDA